jgi:hypothetical protein
MKGEMRVALNQAFVHCKHSGIVKRNVIIAGWDWGWGWGWGLRLGIIGSVTTKMRHSVCVYNIVIFLSIKLNK